MQPYPAHVQLHHTRCDAGLKHVHTICQSVFFQLSDLSLEEMGIESVENMVWKSADGLKTQMWGYSLLGAFDAALSHYLPMTLDSSTSTRSAKAVTDVISSHARLCEFLNGASRPKALKGELCFTVECPWRIACPCNPNRLPRH